MASPSFKYTRADLIACHLPNCNRRSKFAWRPNQKVAPPRRSEYGRKWNSDHPKASIVSENCFRHKWGACVRRELLLWVTFHWYKGRRTSTAESVTDSEAPVRFPPFVRHKAKTAGCQLEAIVISPLVSARISPVRNNPKKAISNDRPKSGDPWQMEYPTMACKASTGKGGARLVSVVDQAFNSLQESCRRCFNCGSKSWRAASVSFARDRPSPVDHSFSRYSDTKLSTCPFWRGKERPSSFNHWKKRSRARS